jgi:hypothetical protein
MTIPQELEAAKAKIQALETELATAKADAKTQVEAATKPLNEKIQTLESEKATEKAAKEKAEADLKASNEEISKLKANDKTAGQKAVEIAASQGTKPVEKDSTSQASAKTEEELWAEYQGINDPAAKTEFYRKHLATKTTVYFKK